jgi:hypothetical protein
MNKMTTKQFLIELTGETFISRTEYFTQQDDSATVAALYSEWIVDGVDPENGEYEWIFIPRIWW